MKISTFVSGSIALLAGAPLAAQGPGIGIGGGGGWPVTCGWSEGGGAAAAAGCCVPFEYPGTTGDQHLLVFAIDDDGVPGVPTGASGIGAVMDYVDDWFQEASYGRASVPWVLVEASLGDPWFPGGSDVYANEHAAVQAAAEAGFAVEAFDRFVFLHSLSQDPVGGFADRSCFDLPDGSSICRLHASTYKFANDQRSREITIHEVGHNFGLAHATHTNPLTGAGQTYGNETNIMGAYGLGPRHFNASHKDQLGWFDPTELIVVDGTGTHVLTPLAAPGGLKALRVGHDHYVEYRRPILSDYGLAGLHNVTEGALVTRSPARSVDSTPESPTDRSDDFALLPGRSIELDDWVVTVTDHDPVAETLEVRVEPAGTNGRPRIDGVDLDWEISGSLYTVTMTVQAHDPDGDPLEAFWSLRADPWAGELHGPDTFGRGATIVEIFDASTGPGRVFVLVTDGKGESSSWWPVDLPYSGRDSVHEVPGDFGWIQAAIDAALPGDLVLLGSGVHGGPGNRDLDVGGKAITIRSVAGSAATVVDAEGLGRGFDLDSGESYLTVIEDLTVTGGIATEGGGIRVTNDGFPFLRDLVLDGNTAVTGGGLYLDGVDTDIDLRRIELRQNVAQDGGGLAVANAWPQLALADLLFEGNAATGRGGAVHTTSSLHLNRCVIRANQAAEGGGLWSNGYFSGRNLLFVDNTASTSGGAYEIDYSFSFLLNSTVAGNSSPTGGAVFLDQGHTAFRNCVVWDNAPDSVGIAPGDPLAHWAADYSVVQGGAPVGEGVLDVDPRFVSATDRHLAADSPCIDAGDGDAATPTDLERMPRVDDEDVADTGVGDPTWTDMGAYERQPAPPGGPTLTASDAYYLNSAVAWDPPADAGSVVEYNIYRSDSPSGPFALVATVDALESSHRDVHGVPPSSTLHHYYRVTAVRPSGESPPSDVGLAVPVCAHLWEQEGLPDEVGLEDFVVFQTLFLQPWQEGSQYADLTGSGGQPDGQVGLADLVAFQGWFLWSAP